MFVLRKNTDPMHLGGLTAGPQARERGLTGPQKFFLGHRGPLFVQKIQSLLHRSGLALLAVQQNALGDGGHSVVRRWLRNRAQSRSNRNRWVLAKKLVRARVRDARRTQFALAGEGSRWKSQ